MLRRYLYSALLGVCGLMCFVCAGMTASASASGSPSAYEQAVLADHPVSYWPLTDPAGSSSVQDLTGLTPGVAEGGATAGSVPGPIAGTTAFSFDGQSCSGVNLDSGASSLAQPNMSVEAWVQTTSGSNGIVFRWRSHGYGLYPTDFSLYPGGNGAGASISTTPAGDGAWHYIVGTYDGSNIDFYVDGVLAASTPATGTPQYDPPGYVAIGRDANACDGVVPSFQGNIAQVATYSYALTAAQVAAHYAAAGAVSGGSGCPATSSAQTLANLDALICRLVHDEGTVVKQQGVLLNVVGGLPHVTPTSILNTWTGPPVVLIPGSDANPTITALQLLEEAVHDAAQELAGMVTDKIAEAFPDVVQGIGDIGGAIEEDIAAAMDEEKAAKATQGAVNGSTPTTLAYIEYHTAQADLHILKKLQKLLEGLEKLKKELQQSGEAQVYVVILVDIEIYEREVSTDITNLTAEEGAISQVPQSGYDILPGLPTAGNAPGAIAVVNPPDFSVNGGLDPSLNAVGMPPGSRLISPTIPNLPTNTTNLGLGNYLNVDTAGFGALTSGQLYIGSTPVKLAEVKTSSTGHFSASAQIPANTPLGAHELYVLGTAPDGSVRVLGASITVSATAPPAIANTSQSHRRWREGNKLARVSRRKHKLPVGTTFSFSLNESANVSFSFTQPAAGRKTKARCAVQPKHRHRGNVCKHSVVRGTLSFAGHAGMNKVSFQGRSGKHKLKPGSYILVITAANAAGHSSPKSLSFTIV
jgi:Concanavalin A-like lectin/glucanases superfamily